MGTTFAFFVYHGHSNAENTAFCSALYEHVFGCLLTWSFALPSLSFDLFNLSFDINLVWNWQLALPSDLLAAADNFTALSFAGAIAKLLTLLGNASFGRILSCYGDAGGVNIPLGSSFQDNTDTDRFIRHNHEDVSVVDIHFRHRYNDETFKVKDGGSVEIRVDGTEHPR